jgi:hypothetical protein
MTYAGDRSWLAAWSIPIQVITSNTGGEVQNIVNKIDLMVVV